MSDVMWMSVVEPSAKVADLLRKLMKGLNKK